jgi:ABC-type sugar transport system ATPase subunit
MSGSPVGNVAETDQALVSIQGLVKQYPGVLAVNGASFTIPKDQIVGLVGKNGAGKSTVIKILAGAVLPDAGEIRVEGQPVAIHDPAHSQALGFGFMHQELEQFPLMSVAENVALGAKIPRRGGAFVDWSALHEQARAMLEDLDPTIDSRQLIDRLSIAQKRVVMIARALLARARLLVLDEPTTSLTDEEVKHLHSVCRRVRERGGTVLYVSHRLDEILSLTDSVIVMRDGEVVMTAATRDTDRRSLISAITGAASAETSTERRRARGIGGRPNSEEILRVSEMASPVISNISFDLRAGEILGIGGLVGSGRTELLRLIYGADKRASGEVFVEGRPVDTSSPPKSLAAGIVLLPEDRRNQGMVLDFTLRENVTLPSLAKFCRPHTLMPHRARERAAAQQMMDRLSIRASGVEQPVRHLSGGNQQKVVLAKWLERGAKVFIFDEPTAGIDVEAKEEIYRLVEELAGEGKGVIFVSSEFSEMVAVCHRVIVMQEGHLAGELEGDEVNETNVIELCYGHSGAAAA